MMVVITVCDHHLGSGSVNLTSHSPRDVLNYDRDEGNLDLVIGSIFRPNVDYLNALSTNGTNLRRRTNDISKSKHINLVKYVNGKKIKRVRTNISQSNQPLSKNLNFNDPPHQSIHTSKDSLEQPSLYINSSLSDQQLSVVDDEESINQYDNHTTDIPSGPIIPLNAFKSIEEMQRRINEKEKYSVVLDTSSDSSNVSAVDWNETDEKIEKKNNNTIIVVLLNLPIFHLITKNLFPRFWLVLGIL